MSKVNPVLYVLGKGGISVLQTALFMPPLKKEGHIALHMSVGMSVSLNLVQLITKECFAQETSDLVGQ